MANKKITELDPAALPLDGSELVELVQGGENVKATAQDIADLSGSSGTPDLATVLGTGNDAGAQQIRNIADGTDPQDAATVAQLSTVTVDVSDQTEAEAIATGANTSSTTGLSNDRVEGELSLYYFIRKFITLGWTWTANQTIGAQLALKWSSLSDNTTISWDAATQGQFATVTLGGNRTLGAIQNPVTGGLYIIRVVQDGSGNRTLAFNAQFTFGGGVTPILNPAAAAQTVLTFFYDGTAMRYCGPSGDYRLANLFLSAQVASGGDQRPLFIDSTGRVQKSAFVNFDEAGLVVKIQGTTAHIVVPSTVSAGNAALITRNIYGVQWQAKDAASNTYFQLELIDTGNGDENLHNRNVMRVRRPLITDHGFGSVGVVREIPAFETTTTASAQNVVFEIEIPTGHVCSIELFDIHAIASNNNFIGVKENKFHFKNVGGTVTGGVTTLTSDPVPNTITATWNWNISGANVQLRLQNGGASNNFLYKCYGALSYRLTQIPV